MVPLGFRSVIGGPKSGGHRGSEDPRERSNTSKGYLSQEILVKNFNISSRAVFTFLHPYIRFYFLE